MAWSIEWSVADINASFQSETRTRRDFRCFEVSCPIEILLLLLLPFLLLLSQDGCKNEAGVTPKITGRSVSEMSLNHSGQLPQRQ